MKIQQMIGKMLTDKKCRLYLLMSMFLGVILMLLPVSNEECGKPDAEEIGFSIEIEEERLEKILSSIDGVRKCHVLLSVAGSTEQVFADNDGETIVVSKGNDEEPITVLERYPEYRGAVVVIGGYSNVNVRFDVLSSVMSYTGLGTDKITICPIQN